MLKHKIQFTLVSDTEKQDEFVEKACGFKRTKEDRERMNDVMNTLLKKTITDTFTRSVGPNKVEWVEDLRIEKGE